MIINSDTSPEQEKHTKFSLYSLKFLWCLFRIILRYQSWRQNYSWLHAENFYTSSAVEQPDFWWYYDFFVYIPDLCKASVVLLPIKWGENLHISR